MIIRAVERNPKLPMGGLRRPAACLAKKSQRAQFVLVRQPIAHPSSLSGAVDPNSSAPKSSTWARIDHVKAAHQNTTVVLGSHNSSAVLWGQYYVFTRDQTLLRVGSTCFCSGAACPKTLSETCAAYSGTSRARSTKSYDYPLHNRPQRPCRRQLTSETPRNAIAAATTRSSQRSSGGGAAEPSQRFA